MKSSSLRSTGGNKKQPSKKATKKTQKFNFQKLTEGLLPHPNAIFHSQFVKYFLLKKKKDLKAFSP